MTQPPQPKVHRGKHGRYVEVHSHDLKAGDQLLVYGHWLVLRHVRKVNRHPYQLVELKFDEIREPLRVPQGWVVKVLAPALPAEGS